MVSPGCAARSQTYSFRAIRWRAVGPWLQRSTPARVGFLWLADLRTAGAWIGPHGCTGSRRGGRGEGPGDPQGICSVPDDLGPQAGSTGDRRLRPASPGRERFRGARVSDGWGTERRLRPDDRRRAQAHVAHVPTLRRPTRRPAQRMEARSVRPRDRRREVLGPRLRGHEGQPDHAAPRGPGLERRRRSAADQPEIRGRGRGGGRQSPLRLLRPCEPGDPARGRRDDRGLRPSPRGNSEDRARMQRHPVRRDDQPHGEGRPAFVVRGDRSEPRVAPDPRAHDPSRREGPDQGARVVQGRAPSDRPRAALPAGERVQGRCAQGILGRLRVRRGRDRLRGAPPPHLFADVHDLRLRERLHRAGHEDRESGRGQGQDRLPPRAEHEAGDPVREAPRPSDCERLWRHRTLSRKRGLGGGGDFVERSGRQSRDQGIGRRLRTRAGSVAVVGRRLGPRILQRGRRRALDLGARRLLRRVELSRAERTLPHGGFRWRREAYGRDDGSSLKQISSDREAQFGSNSGRILRNRERTAAPFPRLEEAMLIKRLSLVVLAFVTFVAVVPPAQAARPGFVFPDICCYYNGAVMRTVVPPAAFPNEGQDNFYVVMGQAIFGVVDVAPGDPGYHGGHWKFNSVTWNVAAYPLTSVSALMSAAAAGDVTVTRNAANDFLCPIQP